MEKGECKYGQGYGNSTFDDSSIKTFTSSLSANLLNSHISDKLELGCVL